MYSCINCKIKGRDENGTVFLLTNIYKSNIELEQLQNFSGLVSILCKAKEIQNQNIVFGGDFNVIFDTTVKSLE